MEAAVRWSPHSTGDRTRFLLVDVAESSLTLNEVDNVEGRQIQHHPVARYTKVSNFNAFAWSSTEESIIALGFVSGNAGLVRLREDRQSSEVLATFKIKQQRKCNSVALSRQNWLAVALDKTRSDVCLNVYDAGAPQASQDPVRRLCAAELVSSVRFFPSQPHELVIGAQKSLVRLYDLRDGYGSAAGSIQASTRNVNNITIDPSDETYFASSGSTDEPNVSVWDKRWISRSGSGAGPVFDFRPAVDNSRRTTVWSSRFTHSRRGRLAICSSTGELKVIDLVQGSISSTQTSEYLPVNPFGGTSWTSNNYVSQARTVEHAYHDTRYGREYDDRIIAFDWIDGGLHRSSDGAIVVLRPDREVERIRVTVANPAVSATGRHDLGVAFNDLSITEVTALASKEHLGGPASAGDFDALDHEGEGETIGGADRECSLDSSRIRNLLAASTLPRERCRRGYRFDCAKNISIVAGYWHLERLWEIIRRLKEQAADEAMVYEDVDLSYTGVAGLWSEKIGSSPQRRSLSSPVRVTDVIVGLNVAKEIPAFEGERTDFPEHRQLCLAVCGWKFTTDTLEQECQELIERGLYYQAIVQAVLHDYKHIALNILRTLIRSRTVPNIGLGALLAADSINDEQREMCLWMSADTEDPALKALLTYLTSGNWRDVMKTNYLHLGYRVALGLKYLNDTELSGFIQSETARAVKNGDLEGVLLTGLGEQAMDLLQTYITKSNDLQTAVLAMGFTSPKFVDDVRYGMWRQVYYDQMHVWRCFNERARFTIEHNRLSKTRDGRSLVQQLEKQVVLKCNHCHSSLARRDGRSEGAARSRVRIAGPAANAGTVCSQCGRHMPRCGICMLWLGTPDSTLQKGRKEDKAGSRMDGFISFCVTCKHGFHAEHARLWFGKHSVCPVPDCACMCGIK